MTPDMTNSENNAPPPALPAPAPVLGYCRACGVALTTANVRYANGTMYCDAHAPMGTAENPYATAAPPPATPVAASDANPGLAFFLGLIPGVGAIYNAQYGKGLLHVVVFGFLVSMADQRTGPLESLFGFLIPAFIFYMAFEAMHTAKRRVAGLPVDEFSSLAPLGGSGFPVGPVLLIGLGVFALLANLEVISVREMMRWWPVGLIALGGYMLYVRTAGGDKS